MISKPVANYSHKARSFEILSCKSSHGLPKFTNLESSRAYLKVKRARDSSASELAKGQEAGGQYLGVGVWAGSDVSGPSAGLTIAQGPAACFAQSRKS